MRFIYEDGIKGRLVVFEVMRVDCPGKPRFFWRFVGGSQSWEIDGEIKGYKSAALAVAKRQGVKLIGEVGRAV